MKPKDCEPYFLLLICIILQITVVPQLGSFLGQLDLLLGLTVVYAMLFGARAGAAWGIGVGLLRGLVGGPTLGIYVIPLYVIGYYVGQFSRLVYRNSVLVPFVIGIVATASYWVLMTIITGVFYGFWIGGRFWYGLLPAAFLNSIFIAAVYASFGKRHQQVVS